MPDITKEPNQNSRLTEGGGGGGGGAGRLQLVCGRPTLALNSTLILQTQLFGLRGRLLAYKCIFRNIEIKIECKIKQT